MTETETNILRALHELDAAVKNLAAMNPKPDLRGLWSRIDELARQLPPDTDPDLRHYLHRRSYEKAKLFLLGREAENQRGSCRH